MNVALTVLLGWYFLSVSVLPGGAVVVATPGPFPNEVACESARSLVQTQQAPTPKYPVTTRKCWESPR